jgi:hypothetical protein
VVVRFKLETHHPVVEPVSAMRRERKFSPQRQAGESRLIAEQRRFQRRAGSEKAPVPALELRDCLRRPKPRDWVVEVVGLELETHHAVIEPVSACAGNGNFRCRDGGAKSGFSLAGDGYRDYQKRAKAPIWRRKCEDIHPSSIPGDWVVGAPGLEPGTR